MTLGIRFYRLIGAEVGKKSKINLLGAIGKIFPKLSVCMKTSSDFGYTCIFSIVMKVI